MAKEESEQEELDMESWEDFSGDYLKAEFIKEFPVKLPCIGIESSVEDGKVSLTATVEFKDKTKLFGLNKTNQAIIRAAGIVPKDIVGKVFTCEKTKVRNPSTNSMVDSLIIDKIE